MEADEDKIRKIRPKGHIASLGTYRIVNRVPLGRIFRILSSSASSRPICLNIESESVKHAPMIRFRSMAIKCWVLKIIETKLWTDIAGCQLVNFERHTSERYIQWCTTKWTYLSCWILKSEHISFGKSGPDLESSGALSEARSAFVLPWNRARQEKPSLDSTLCR